MSDPFIRCSVFIYIIFNIRQPEIYPIPQCALFQAILPLAPFPSGLFVSLSHVWFQVRVHLEASPAFLAVPGEKEQETQCICGNGRQTVSWAVTPKSLGERQPLRGSSLLKDSVCLSMGSSYPGKDAPTARQMVEVFSLSFILGCLEGYTPFPHLWLHLGFSVSLASSLCCFHSCSYVFIEQKNKVTKH